MFDPILEASNKNSTYIYYQLYLFNVIESILILYCDPEIENTYCT